MILSRWLLTVTYIYMFNGHFPSEPGLANCPPNREETMVQTLSWLDVLTNINYKNHSSTNLTPAEMSVIPSCRFSMPVLQQRWADIAVF